MADAQVNLSDDELRGVLPELSKDPNLLNKLDSDSRRRFTKIQAQSAPRTWTDTAVDALPMAGGALGGIVGGIGGTAFGMGVGGVPGAVGGATLGGGAGEAARQLINRWRGADAPATPSDAALSIAEQGGIQGAFEGAGQAAAAVAPIAAKAVYRGYLKPSLAKASVGRADDIVQTALDEALPVSRGGRDEAKQIIGGLKQKVDDILATAPGTVDMKSVADRVRNWAQQQFGHAGLDDELNAAYKVADSLDKSSALAQTGKLVTDVSPSEANTIKQGLYAKVGTNQYGLPSKAATTAQKVGASAIRSDLEDLAPAIGPLNARESKLIDTAKAINRAVQREANQSPIYGVKTLAAGAIGLGAAGGTYAASRDPAKAAEAFALTLAGRAALVPAVATRAAIVASRLAGRGMEAATAARVAVAAVLEAQRDGSDPAAHE